MSPRTPEGAAGEIGADALVLQGDELGDQLALVDLLADFEIGDHRGVVLDGADAVDARDRGDDDDVVAFEQGAGRRVAHPVDLLVDGRFLLDIGVGTRDVGLGLVVVVIGDEILDGVVREEGLELAIELGGQRLVGRKDEGRAVGLGDDLGHGEGLARTGDAQKHLVGLAGVDAFDQLLDRRRLVAGGFERRGEAEGDAALGLLGTLRTVRHPGRGALDLLAAMFDQVLQGGDGGGDAAPHARSG